VAHGRDHQQHHQLKGQVVPETEEDDVVRWLTACLRPFAISGDDPNGQRLLRQLSVLYDKGLIEPGPTAILFPEPENL
jgi:hypothetical protein